MQQEIEKLINIVEDISKGHYSSDIFQFTSQNLPDYIVRLAEAIGMMMVKIEAREFNLENLIQQLNKLNEQIKINTINTVTSISRALGARDTYTEGHAERVAIYAERLANRIGLDSRAINDIRIAGLLHDIGKINFSDKIFSHNDVNLPKDMYDEIKRHPQIAWSILKDLDFLGEAVQYVLHHHERNNGRGYPDGLTDQQIPYGAKIISVCDCFDAMTYDRSYQKAKTQEEAFEILRKLSTDQLDEVLVEQFILEIHENGMIIWK